MRDPDALEQIGQKYGALAPLMDERMRRQWAAAEAQSVWLGRRACGERRDGMSPNTIRKGLAELAAREKHPEAPVALGLRRPGGGRKAH